MKPVHLPVNQRVPGSSPGSGAKAPHVRGAFLFQIESFYWVDIYAPIIPQIEPGAFDMSNSIFV